MFRKSLPGATEAELADAVEDLLTRAGHGPGDGGRPAPAPGRRDRRVAARTRAVRPAAREEPEPLEEPAAGEPGDEPAGVVVPMPIFDPFREAEKW